MFIDYVILMDDFVEWIRKWIIRLLGHIFMECDATWYVLFDLIDWCMLTRSFFLLLGEGKRSGPNSISHPVIPHPSCQVALNGGAGSSTSSPAVSSLLPELLFHASGPLETAADPPSSTPPTSRIDENVHRADDDDDESERLLLDKTQKNNNNTTNHHNHNNNNNNNNNHNNNNNSDNNNSGSGNRKRKSLSTSIFPPSPVSSRLRSRSLNDNGNAGCNNGLDCSNGTTCGCCHLDKSDGSLRHPTADECTSPVGSFTPESLDDHDDTRETMDKSQQRLGSDILMALADKISGGRKRCGKKQSQPGHVADQMAFLEQLGDERIPEPPLKKCRRRDNKLSLPDVVKSRSIVTKKSSQLNSKIAARAASPAPIRPEAGVTVNGHKTVSIRRRSQSRSPLLPPVSSSSPVLRWSNGWSWEGSSFRSLVHLRNEDVPAVRKCYPAMRHSQGDVVRMRDCILLKSGPKAKDLPFVAKVSALWENAEDGEMMMSLLWYYRPEHTEGGRRSSDLDDEIFASRHRDVCSVACIEDKCYVLTFNEYCRWVD